MERARHPFQHRLVQSILLGSVGDHVRKKIHDRRPKIPRKIRERALVDSRIQFLNRLHHWPVFQQQFRNDLHHLGIGIPSQQGREDVLLFKGKVLHDFHGKNLLEVGKLLIGIGWLFPRKQPMRGFRDPGDQFVISLGGSNKLQLSDGIQFDGQINS